MSSRAPLPGRRLFFSYGWQDNLALVPRLEADLMAGGWDVWHDKNRIHGGDAFTAEIEEGIRWCDVLIAFMGPHSTRRAGDADSRDHRDSICHREISMADTVKGQGRIVPIMTVECTPPLLLQGLDYIDMAGCPAAEEKYARAYAKLLDALEDARAGKVRYRAWYANLRPVDTDRLRGLRFHPLDAGRSDNRDDIRSYVEARLRGRLDVTERHVETLCDRGAGNLLYVVQTLADLEVGVGGKEE